ncbi:MAG: DUF4397 domain-containing protein [Deltaproteobacteria bacterium]|nr:DUF4397 domain-containing protein [Deltaproteobacteria bacterium]
MKRTILSMLIFALLASGCDSGGGGSDAQVRLIQAGPMTQALSLYVDQDLVDTLTYGQVGDYDDTDAGPRTLRGIVGTTEVFSTTLTLDSDIDYSVLTVQEGAAITPVLIADNNSSPDFQNFSIRAINASTRAPLVDIYVLHEGDSVVDHEPNFSTLAFKQASNYDQIDRTEWVLWATIAGTKTVVAQAPSQEFKSQETWSAILEDSASGSGVTFVLNKDRDGDEFNF